MYCYNVIGVVYTPPMLLGIHELSQATFQFLTVFSNVADGKLVIWFPMTVIKLRRVFCGHL